MPFLPKSPQIKTLQGSLKSFSTAIKNLKAKSVTIGKLREALDISAETIFELLTEVQKHYAERSINVEFTKKGYVLVPNRKYRPYYRKFVKVKKATYNKQTFETIAILLKSDSTKARINRLP